MRMCFYGGAGTVTGSCYMIDTGEIKFLVDCGMFQGSKEIKERNYNDFPFRPEEISFVLLTHAHIDHSGLIPKLYKKGFTGDVFTTAASKELCSIMLPDSGHIQEMEVERKNRKLKRAGKSLLEPIYTALEAENCLEIFKSVNYDEIHTINDTVKVRFRDAGHIFGSAMIEVWIGREQKTKILFSGDIGNINQPIIEDPESITRANYVVMESTYGNRVHGEENVAEMSSKKEQIEEIIQKTAEKGGNLIIPAFAVERTQDLLYYISRLEEEDRLYGMQIVIDSPLAISATEIFCKHPEYYDKESQKLLEEGTCPIMPRRLKIARTSDESKELNEVSGGYIIISSSGMCDAGRIKHHLKHNLWRKDNSVLITGYQAPGTLGRRIVDGAEKVRIHGEEIQVKAEIYAVKGFSAHADQTMLVDWVKNFNKKPDTIYITHGEKEAAENLAGILENNLGVNTAIPDYLDCVDLEYSEIASVEKGEEKVGKIKEIYSDVLSKLDDKVHKNISQRNYDYIMKMLQNINHLLKK